jgi:endonuclease-3
MREVYGVPLMKPHGDPIAELVLTVLSQSTNDRNRDVAYLRLRERFASWEATRPWRRSRRRSAQAGSPR